MLLFCRGFAFVSALGRGKYNDSLASHGLAAIEEAIAVDNSAFEFRV